MDELMQSKTAKEHHFNFRNFLFSYGLLIVMFFVIVYFSITAKNFFSITNLLTILHTTSPLFVIACGIGLVIMTGKIDISVGSTLYLSTVIGSILMIRLNVPIAVAAISVLIIGVLLGAINGLLVVFLQVNPFIATLGTLYAYRGIGLQLTKANVMSLPSELRHLGNLRVGSIYVDIIFSLLVLVIMYLVHTRTKFGRHVMAYGNGAGISKKLGVKVNWISFLTFVLSGFFASLGGILLTLQIGAVTTTAGTGYEFLAIAMLVIGGISFFGGEGSILPGILIGGVTLTVIESGLNYIGASVYVYPFVRGGIIFLAMFSDSLKLQIKPKVKLMADIEALTHLGGK
jgi:ribose/xylose/arabinose/galactoside ABC-type transport system permease subunit